MLFSKHARLKWHCHAVHARHAMPDGKPPVDLHGTVMEGDDDEEKPKPAPIPLDKDDTAHGGGFMTKMQDEE